MIAKRDVRVLLLYLRKDKTMDVFKKAIKYYRYKENLVQTIGWLISLEGEKN